MLITKLTADLLRVPLPRVRSLPRAEDAQPGKPPPHHVTVLLVHLQTDAGVDGIGFSYIPSAERIVSAIIDNELRPRLIGADPLSSERLYSVMHRGLSDGGLLNGACAAIDVAAWDLRSKAANIPLWSLLGGAREAAPAHVADTAAAWMSAEQVISAYESAQSKGITGLRVAIGGRSPEADARRLEEIRNHVGLDAWFAVSADGAYDAATALAVGRFLEEEMDADWFEDPVPADDRAGLRRLADKLELPIAVGGQFDRAADFTSWLTESAAGVIRPDIPRLGGLTPALPIIAAATAFARPIVPVLMPEVAVHLACGLPGVRAVDYVGWLEPLWKSGPTAANGRLGPPPGPGLGLELDPDAVERFRIGP